MLKTETNTADSFRPVPEVYAAVPASMRLPLYAAIEDIPEGYHSGDDSLDAVLSLEESVLGVSRDDNNFFTEHYKFLTDCDVYLKRELPAIGANLVDSLASYLAKSPEDVEMHKVVLQERLAAITEVSVNDHLLDGNLGSFSQLTRRISISGLAFLGLKAGDIPEDDLKNVLLSHEIIHGLLASARTSSAMKRNAISDATFDLINRNGVATESTVDGELANTHQDLHRSHQLLNEAVLEDIRQRVLGTSSAGYRSMLSCLRAMYDLEPSLRGTIENAAFFDGMPSDVTGAVENILGPLVLEKVESFMSEGPADSFPVYSVEEKTELLEILTSALPKDSAELMARSFYKHYDELSDTWVYEFLDKY